MLIAIVTLFVAPIVVAWLFASGVLDWHMRKQVNLGELLSPPIDLGPQAAKPGFAPLFALAPSEWAMVYLEPQSCAQQCVDQLDALLVVRELLGQGAVRASVHAIAAHGTANTAHAARVHVDSEALEWLVRELRLRGSTRPLPAVVLVDWRRQMMMRYAPGERRAIQKDLKKLLRASAIR